PDAEGTDEERARYWRARALLDADPSESEVARDAAWEAARADLVWLVEMRPLSYHGLLARGRLAELAPERPHALEAQEAQRVSSAMRQRGPLQAGPLARDPH